MEGIPANLLIHAGVIAAALIAGFFSFLNLVISKQQKISEFRQSWIDKLREDVSKYTASITYLASTNKIWIDGGRKNPQQYYESVRIAFTDAAEAFTSIVLRINPSDGNKKIKPKNDAFLSTMNAVRDAVRADQYEVARKKADELTEKVQPILKHEWKRVKKGEAIYRLTQAVALLVLVVGLVAALFFAFRT